MGKLIPIVVILLAAASAGVSIAVISIIRSSLWFTTGGWWGGWWYSTGSFCYLSTSSANLCSYGYVFSKLRPQWSPHNKIEVLVLGFGTIWWFPYAVVTTVYGKRADSAGLSQKSERTSVWALAWAAFGLFTLQLVACILDFGNHSKIEGPAGAQYGSSPPYQGNAQYPAQQYGAAPQYGSAYAYGNATYQPPPQYPPPYQPGGTGTVTGFPQQAPGSAPPQAVRPV
ncbi:hypothetical protein F751_5754 [Auxenochlorella protothecoides]|uniref:Uncharacterized protein n=1 Tax=Auxenochlorella protothecoides TaxID=3075 RepID=A0A087SUB2_AUXPR|nr:hypothetical protein F751_5754 [Auxenochlorella protothecoides]KFM29316.1 hypothetical protein F751_5754 [Auxenochlorella protothecoides]RMZ52943.1 hypothetical protein APUTEX25_001062 [Auxenochlorella protothecoides]|eukprot:RMZ52943.1 hypothetical protein APUTEX25_001062 [Auxenochlorella protothecoides]